MRHLYKQNRFIISFLTLILIGLLFSFIQPNKALALSGSDFRAGKIVDDSVFYNGNAMNSTEIQNFLNAKVPSCDVNGTQASSHWYDAAGRYYTRAEWGSLNGYPAPYTCLKNYTVNTPTKAADSYCGGQYAGGNKTAAQIINEVGIACGISQKAMIVLLQKEQGLITDDWPWSIQYRSATGYGCPDTAACDSTYYGFFNQVYNAARQFKRYAIQSQLFNYRGGQTSYIQYNPNAGCGGSNVYIENAATAGLYNYTPYQPNASALNNLYGTGDSCSAYGNRNFWRMFNDWFSSNSLVSSITMNTISQPDTTPARGQTVSYTISFTSNLPVDITVDALGIVGRAGSLTNGTNRDFGWVGPITLKPGITQQFTFTTIIQDSGILYVWPAINYQGTYTQYNNWGAALNIHQPNISLVSPLSSSIPNPVVGQTTTLSATIKNNEDQPININPLGIPVRYYDTYNYDCSWLALTNPIQPGATQTVSGTVTFDKPGPYTAWVSSVIANQYTSLSQNIYFNIQKATPNFTLSYLETPNQSPALGEDVVIKFKLKNNLSTSITINAVGVVGRYDNPYNGTNRDFGWVGPESFTPGEEKSYTSFVSNVSDLKNFYAWVAIYYQNNYYHYNNWGFMMTPRLPNLTLSTPITINSGAAPVVGQISTITATIKNNELKPIKYNALGLPIRYYNKYNYDASWQGQGTLSASGLSGDTASLTGTIVFDKGGAYTLWTSILIQGRYITIGNTRTINL